MAIWRLRKNPTSGVGNADSILKSFFRASNPLAQFTLATHVAWRARIWVCGFLERRQNSCWGLDSAGSSRYEATYYFIA
jgi:hypothetical protein